MLPLIIGGAALAALYKVKPECAVCGTKFGWNQNCIVGGEHVCGDCGSASDAVVYQGQEILVAGRCCKIHQLDLPNILANRKSKIDDEIRITTLADKVVTFSRNFRGKTPDLSLNREIRTGWFLSKQGAALSLKYLAASLGCNVVIDEHFQTKSDDDPENVHHTITWFMYQGRV